MITYNPREWFGLIFQFHRSDTFRILLPLMLFMGLCTAGLVYIEVHHQLYLRGSTVFHQILGFALSMLLVFRINTAYERWWEGRKLWGSLVNNSRSLACKLYATLSGSKPDDLRFLLSILELFPATLRDHLRNESPADQQQLATGFDSQQFLKAPHRPYYLYQLIVERLEALRASNTLTSEQLLLINNEVFSLIDITGACERIKRSPIPFSYSLYLKKILFVYIITMPIPFAAEFGYWAVLAVVFIFYGFASLELISEEIEDPFGNDANDLPLDDLSERIAADVGQVAGKITARK